MCRFIGYLGSPVLLAEIVSRPDNSLIRQSYKSKERSEPLNGDGFGIGWYTPELSEEACVFTSTTPAWSNRNLLSIAGHVTSGCFFAHVRSASPGMLVSESNCHPFSNGRYMWMHNGTIEGFLHLKRRLLASLPDNLYNAIHGTTDSEHAFALFLDLLGIETPSAPELSEALVRTIWRLEEWAREAHISKPSIYNFAVTDGENIATVRYVSDPEMEPISLYFSKRGRFQCHNGTGEIVECGQGDGGIIVASEPLTADRTNWTRVAPNHVLLIDAEHTVRTFLIPEP